MKKYNKMNLVYFSEHFRDAFDMVIRNMNHSEGAVMRAHLRSIEARPTEDPKVFEGTDDELAFIFAQLVSVACLHTNKQVKQIATLLGYSANPFIFTKMIVLFHDNVDTIIPAAKKAAFGDPSQN